MALIIPAVIPQNSAHLADTLRSIGTWSTEIQIDIVDGVFVPDISWPYVDGGTVQDLSLHSNDLSIETDLMIAEPEKVIEAYLQAGVERIVVHLEAVRNLSDIIVLKQRYSFKLGFSINNDTPLSQLEEVIGYADYVQLMGIAVIGSQGQPFDERVLDRIRILKHAYAALPISIDGSVNETTIPLLLQAGADRLVCGSAIVRAEDPQEAHQRLMRIAMSNKF